MTKTGRGFLVALILAVAGYLLPLAQFQSAHDLLEISIHGESTRHDQSVRATDAAARPHDCHSCLAHHPGASVFSAPGAAKFAGPLPELHWTVAFVSVFGLRITDIPNKRSPPIGFA